MSDEHDSWFQGTFGVDLGGAAKRIEDEARAAAKRLEDEARAAKAQVTNVVQTVQKKVDGVIDDVVNKAAGVVKKVAAAAGGGGAGGGGAGGGSPKTAAPAGGGTGKFPLSGSVGRGGQNAPNDVKAVQRALGIADDGQCGTGTITAIENFQRQIGQKKPDGRVDAGGATERALTKGGMGVAERVNMPGEDESAGLLGKALDGAQGLAGRLAGGDPLGVVTDFVSDPIGAVRTLSVQPFFVELDSAGDQIAAAADCSTMCRALASMRRAAEKICALAGDSSDECRRARSKVSESARSVANAGCKCDDTRPPIAVSSSIDEVLPEPEDPETLSQSAQAGDIETALKNANLFNKQADVAAMLPKAKVPDGVSLNISIVVSKGLNVSFRVVTNPNDPSGARLAALLSGKFAAPMKAALQKAKLTITDTVTVGWLTF